MMRVCKRYLFLLCIATLLSIPAAAGGNNASDSGVSRFVALTFDDGPTGPLTEQLIRGLQKRYVPATFFLCGYRVEQFPDVVHQLAANGHELAIHGQSHKFLHDQSPEIIREELQQTSAQIEALTGERPRLFRPPGGLTSDVLLAEAAAEQLPIILWSVDPQDWNCTSAACIAQRIVTHVSDGDIILMHDLSKTSISAAFQIIDRLQAQGYQFCTVSELAALRKHTLEPAEIYHHFHP